MLHLGIKNVMNIFQTSLQQDLEISTLKTEKLTEKFKLMTLNFCEDMPADSDFMPLFIKQELQLEEMAVKSGRLDAVLFWFEMTHPYSEVRFSTIDTGSHFKAAACLLDCEECYVEKGEKVQLFAELDRSELRISLVNSC